MIEEVDIDGNGSIDFEEFMTMVTAGKQYSKKDVLSALNILDKSKSGRLS